VIDVVVATRPRASPSRAATSRSSGPLRAPAAVDATALRTLLPQTACAAYDIRAVVAHCPTGLGARAARRLRRRHRHRAGAHRRPAGRPARQRPGVHLGGAIDADGADKAARFMQLCDAHALPLVSLIDTPGFMVGPEIESRGQVRHVSRMFVVGAQLRVPVAAIVLRKAYGLGAMAMAAGGMHAPMATVAWPSGEFGAMGSKARSSSATARSWPRRAKATSARRCASGWSPRSTRRARRSNGGDARDRRRHRPGRQPALARCDARIGAPARAGRALHRPVVGASGQWCACSAGSAAS
jgi:acetyl-CoA carboxylase carboxyltransferase component